MDAAWMVDGWCWIWWLRELPEPRRVTHLFGWLLMVIWVLTNALACGRRRHHHHHPSSIIHHPSSVIHHPSSVIRHPSSVIRHPSSIIIIISPSYSLWHWFVFAAFFGVGLWMIYDSSGAAAWLDSMKAGKASWATGYHMIATCLPVKTWAAMGWTRIKWMVFSATRVFLGLGFS